MRFGKILSSLAIPQWKECYVDYETLKILVIIIKDIIELIESTPNRKTEKKKTTKKKFKGGKGRVAPQLQQNADLTFLNLANNKEAVQDNYVITGHINSLKEILKQANIKFFQMHDKSMKVSQFFFHMKFYELSQKFHYYVELSHYPNLENPQIQINKNYLSLLQYNYVQLSFLSRMTDIVLQGERKILKKHKKCSEDSVPTPVCFHLKIDRIRKQINTLQLEAEDHYVRFTNMPSKKSRQLLRQMAQSNQTQQIDSFLFGFFIGIVLTVMIVLVTMLIYSHISIENHPLFNRDFPTWRGVAFFIFYIWITGINVWVYETYCVNHKLIFKFNDHHASTSTQILRTAGYLTTIFFIMFFIYCLDITGVARLGNLPSHFLVVFVWASLIIYIFAPIPYFNHKGRIYVFKILLLSISAPITGVTYPIIFATDQMITLITPLKDLAYTGCYYTQLNLNNSSSTNVCSDSNKPIIVLIIGVCAYSLRIIQCIRQGYDNGEYFNTAPFYNTLKYLSSTITAILSYYYKAGNNSIFVAWVISAAISTFYSYYWDLKIDWGLLQPNCRNRFLRKYLTYTPIYNYYILMAMNFLLRLAWILTLSPSIVAQFGNPQIFSLVTGALEIIRRGFWNILRTQKQHLANCGNFKAIPQVNHIETQLEVASKVSLRNKRLLNALIQMTLKKENVVKIQYPNQDKLSQYMKNINQCNPQFKDTIKQMLERINTEKAQIRQYAEKTIKEIQNIKKEIQEIKKDS